MFMEEQRTRGIWYVIMLETSMGMKLTMFVSDGDDCQS